MAVVYASLIIKGRRTIDSVPAVIRDRVVQVLIDLDLPELCGDYLPADYVPVDLEL